MNVNADIKVQRDTTQRKKRKSKADASPSGKRHSDTQENLGNDSKDDNPSTSTAVLPGIPNADTPFASLLAAIPAEDLIQVQAASNAADLVPNDDGIPHVTPSSAPPVNGSFTSDNVTGATPGSEEPDSASKRPRSRYDPSVLDRVMAEIETAQRDNSGRCNVSAIARQYGISPACVHQRLSRRRRTTPQQLFAGEQVSAPEQCD